MWGGARISFEENSATFATAPKAKTSLSRNLAIAGPGSEFWCTAKLPSTSAGALCLTMVLGIGVAPVFGVQPNFGVQPYSPADERLEARVGIEAHKPFTMSKLQRFQHAKIAKNAPLGGTLSVECTRRNSNRNLPPHTAPPPELSGTFVLFAARRGPRTLEACQPTPNCSWSSGRPRRS